MTLSEIIKNVEDRIVVFGEQRKLCIKNDDDFKAILFTINISDFKYFLNLLKEFDDGSVK